MRIETVLAIGCAACVCVIAPAATASAQVFCGDGRVDVGGGHCCWPGQTATAEGYCAGPPTCPDGLSASGAECVGATPTVAACVEGRVSVGGGYCCWPGQHVTEEGRCTGPPRCPAGLVAAGAECTASVALRADSADVGVAGDGSFRSTVVGEASPGGTEVRAGLLVGGIILIAVGWLGSGIVASIGSTVSTSDATGRFRIPALSGAWPFGWVPLLHPLAALSAANSTWGLVAGIIGAGSAAMEIAGLVMAIVGQIGRPRSPANDALSLRLGAPSADAGVSLVLAF